MAGHSKWKNIQHRKGRQDARKAKFFTKAAKEIIIAAKSGGDPSGNARLRAAIAAARAVNLPKDKIENAIKKGTGEIAGGDIMEVVYEGYGPSGVALMIEVATDNKNRTVPEIRHLLAKHGGNLGETGCVGWMFDKKGVIVFPKAQFPEEETIMEIGLEAGADDVIDADDSWEVLTAPDQFEAVREAFEAKNMSPDRAEIEMLAQTTVNVDVETGKKIMRLVDALEDNDDVQNVHGNFELPEELFAEA